MTRGRISYSQVITLCTISYQYNNKQVEQGVLTDMTRAQCLSLACQFYEITDVLLLTAVSPAMLVSVLPSPVVLVNQTGSSNLECVAGGGPENTFQWYHDNELLSGETHSVLELTDIGISGGGYFNCTVINAAGTGSNTTLVVGVCVCVCVCVCVVCLCVCVHVCTCVRVVCLNMSASLPMFV